MTAGFVVPPGSAKTEPDHTFTMMHHTPHLQTRRALRRSLVAVVLAIVGLIATGTAPAHAGGLPRNALAFDVVASANEAIAALDMFTMTGDPAQYLEYRVDRDATAALAAAQLGYDVPSMVQAWSSTPIDHQRAVLSAMSQVGVPYRTNTSQEGVGFDCSGLTTYAWGRAGVGLTRQSGSQIREAAPVDRASAKAGDIVYYPGHVMLYLGVGDAIIHAVHTGRTVEIDTISGRKSGSVRFGNPGTF